jgi:hypothetical protein
MPVISQILFFDIVFDLGRGYYRDGLNEFQKAYFLIKRNLTFAFLFWFFFFVYLEQPILPTKIFSKSTLFFKHCGCI